jgi:threonine dehydratase
MADGALDIGRLLAAAGFIDPVFLDTELRHSPGLDAALGCALALKVECINPIGSFKGRGTELFAATALQPGDALVCASAGNFGQGLARAAHRRGHHCTVFASENANPLKVAAMRRLEAEVWQVGADFDAAKAAARQFARETGQRFVEDGAEPAIAEGAGTIALEIVAALPELETIVVPLGNGALLAGIGAALRHVAPRVEVIGVVASKAPAMKLSIEAGHLIETAAADTIADGIAVRQPVSEALDMLKERVDRLLTVDEEDLRHAMQLCYQHLGLAIEPAGIAGLAAIQSHAAHFRGKRVASILCGANLTPELKLWLTGNAA